MNIEKMVIQAIELYSNKEYDKSLNIYFKILRTNIPKEVKRVIYFNAGLCYFSKYSYIDSEKYFKKSFDLGYHTCGYELCMSYLFNDNYLDGYKYYNYRHVEFLKLPIKRVYDLKDITGNVLVLNEQGFGDEILFSRVIEKITTPCYYQVYDENYNLFKDIFKNDNITFFTERSFNIEFVNKFDCFCYTGDLFSKNIIDNGIIPYGFKSDNNSTGNVGLVWNTNKKSKNSEERSIDISKLESLINSDLTIHNLQKGISDERMINYDFKDFLDTKKVIDTLDCVYTVDTSVAHLSALLGKKTYILYDSYLDWRWKSKYYNNFELLNIKDLH